MSHYTYMSMANILIINILINLQSVWLQLNCLSAYAMYQY